LKRRVKIGERNPVEVEDHLIEISGHAVRSYRERFKPNVSLSGARQDLETKLATSGEITRQRPTWLSGYTNDSEAYAVLEDGDLALPLRRHTSKPGVFVVPTCLYRC
jgi:hypothetical protein